MHMYMHMRTPASASWWLLHRRCANTHTRTHRCVDTGWALGLLKASARGGWEIGHPPTANNNNISQNERQTRHQLNTIISIFQLHGTAKHPVDQCTVVCIWKRTSEIIQVLQQLHNKITPRQELILNNSVNVNISQCMKMKNLQHGSSLKHTQRNRDRPLHITAKF